MNKLVQRWIGIGTIALVLPVAAAAQEAFARGTVNLRAGPRATTRWWRDSAMASPSRCSAAPAAMHGATWCCPTGCAAGSMPPTSTTPTMMTGACPWPPTAPSSACRSSASRSATTGATTTATAPGTASGAGGATTIRRRPSPAGARCRRRGRTGGPIRGATPATRIRDRASVRSRSRAGGLRQGSIHRRITVSGRRVPTAVSDRRSTPARRTCIRADRRTSIRVVHRTCIRDVRRP